ncbi:sigma factor-like helix-turn-helix DNA-binding protein [Paractinoplanes ferrugineus]|uniref:RNA polymerase sigma24 factor n=1 Tax=Paractinoplanes ferrugineus TaxID=113564 RepID=A0A919MM26_9ACTN|nr:sigma-70 family RNA polymerase sigma factor [Actinoplanes ferrugineus]GIE12812.1 RNA polymerase sigma24 factor [Actinoplanes ferrugineus]
MITHLLREHAPTVLGVLARRCGSFDDAEDAVQEALIAAHLSWPEHGVPDNPRGWLLQTATRKLIDQIRNERARRRREELVARLDEPGDAYEQDDTLHVLMMCCHPELTEASQVALTLRAAGGLRTAEIAAAFLVPEATMAQRISRAKQKLRGRPFGPGGDGTALRRVLYLIFNEGYASSTGPALHRRELSAEAIRLARKISHVDSESAALLALMLLTDARRPARTNPDGDLVPLDEQDRTRWDRSLIFEGTAILDAAVGRGTVGEYQLQAAVAALHCRAVSFETTDWPQISALYGLLERLTGNPVVSLNRAVAVAMVDGPAAGLAVLDDLGDRLAGSHRIDAVRAHLLERAGEPEQAARLYAAAAARTTSLPERRYLTTRAARLR